MRLASKSRNELFCCRRRTIQVDLRQYFCYRVLKNSRNDFLLRYIDDADQIIQTDLIQLRQTDGNGDRQLPDAFFISGIHIAVAAEIVGNLADRQIAVRAQILQSLILVFFRLFTEICNKQYHQHHHKDNSA